MDPLLRKLLDAWSGPLGVSLVDLALAGLTALACGFVIGETYRRTYRGHDYSRSFLQVLLVITLLVAFVTLVVGNDLARAFTLVGAMSVVRFRTAVKEARDLAFIFWAVATGMGAGSRFVALTVAFTLAVALVVVLLTWRGWGVRDPELQVLRVRFDSGADYEGLLDEPFKRLLLDWRRLSVGLVRQGTLYEVVYLVRLSPKASGRELVDQLRALNEGHPVTLSFREESYS
ncbi:MAG TPA: DUF4956 domain-containing protein [Planctomycetes bacterium]|nr:DUF4956 domain-containing protein [Planctomycetota bacterium]